MEMLVGVGVLGLWFVALALLMRGQAMVPVLIGLAVAWAIMTGGGRTVLQDVLDAGILGFAGVVMVIIMGAWLSETMLQVGIAETLIRNAAELAGDKPFAVAVAMIVVITFLFTSMYGVGAAVMVGVIALPIMLSIGIPPTICAPIFTMSIIAGLQVNLVEFKTVAGGIFKVSTPFSDDFKLYVVQVIIWAVVAIVFAWVKLRKLGTVRAHAVDTGYGGAASQSSAAPGLKAPWYALLTPIVPVAGVMIFGWPLTAAFVVGVVFALLTTIHQRPFKATVDLFQKALYDGFRTMAPVCAVWIIIGTMVKAASLPSVQAPLKALLGNVLPSSPATIITFLAVLAPLAVYRGPLCIAGVGAALVPLFLGMNVISAGMLFGAWKPINHVHGTTDPINSWTLWTLGFLNIPGSTHIRTALPFTWVAAALCAFAALVMSGR